jgi:hypothetical protein
MRFFFNALANELKINEKKKTKCLKMLFTGI